MGPHLASCSSLVEGTNITLTFSAGAFGGYGGCNQYGARYTLTEDGVLAMIDLENTAQLCQIPDGIMEQEAAYLKALLSAFTYHELADRLEIVDAAGETILIFARQEQFPMDPTALEGTWPYDTSGFWEGEHPHLCSKRLGHWLDNGQSLTIF